MIEQYYKNPNKKSYVYESYYAKEARKKKITETEFHRRQSILVKLSTSCNVFAGMEAWPKWKEFYDRYGKCRIVGVCRSYSDMGADEWPDNDNPMIILAHSSKTNANFTATSNFFSKEEPNFEPAC